MSFQCHLQGNDEKVANNEMRGSANILKISENKKKIFEFR